MANINIYFKSILEKNIYLQLSNINNNLEKNMLSLLQSTYEGKCTDDGYIKINSINIINYSSGLITDNNIKFNVSFECMICYPVEGMIIDCLVKNITKAGIRCELDEDNSPLVIFVARDHHYQNSEFNDLNENDIINVKIIGQRFELNDKYISIISEYIGKSSNLRNKLTKITKEKVKKPKLKVLDN